MMADITMCVNDKCPLSGKCYRSTAKANKDYQAFQWFEYTIDADNGPICEDFIDNKP